MLCHKCKNTVYAGCTEFQWTKEKNAQYIQLTIQWIQINAV